MTCGCRKIRRTRLLPPLARGVLAFCHLSVAGARNPGSRRVRPWACVRQLPLIPLRAYVQRKRRARMFSTGFAVSSCRLPVRARGCRPVRCQKPQAASCLVRALVGSRFNCLRSVHTAIRGISAWILLDTCTLPGQQRHTHYRQGSGQQRAWSSLQGLLSSLIV